MEEVVVNGSLGTRFPTRVTFEPERCHVTHNQHPHAPSRSLLVTSTSTMSQLAKSTFSVQLSACKIKCPNHHNTTSAPPTKPMTKANDAPAPTRVICNLSTPPVGPPWVLVPMSDDHAPIPSTVPTAGELGGIGVL